jgi:hypothetical protein
MDAVIADVSTNNHSQPLTYFRDGVVHSPSEFVFYFAQLRWHPFTNRLPQHSVVSVASRLPADMREAKEGKRFRLSFSTLLPVSGRVPPELQKSRFVAVQFRAELPKPLSEFRKKLFGIDFALESNHDVRLPTLVHDRHTSLDFPMRPKPSSTLGERGISRFPCKVLRCVPGVCDRAELGNASR